MTPRGKTRLTLWLVVVGVFVLGCVTGAALGGVYRLRAAGGPDGRGRHNPEAKFDELRRGLNLSDEQARQVRAILDETREQYRSLRTEVRPRYDTLRQQARTRIRAVLTPEQQQRFDAVTAAHDAHRAADDRDEH